MIKAVVLLKRKDELSAQAFADWLLKEHLPMVLKLPGLRRTLLNTIQKRFAGSGKFLACRAFKKGP